MNKTYKKFILSFIIIFITLLYFLYKYNNKVEQNQVDILVSNRVEIVQNELTNQKNHALSLAILFSKNQNVISFLENDKPNELKKELLKSLENIKNYTNINNIQIQVHIKDLKVFVRSWEDKDEGLSLESFRKGIVKVKQSQEPFVSNELGKRFNIKAISPIFNQNSEYIGSLEVIIDYSDLKNRLKYMGIDIIPLLKKEYLPIATYYQEYNMLDDFVVIQNDYDKKFYDYLYFNKKYLSTEQFYYKNDNKIVTQIPLGDIDSKSVGVLMICFDKNEQNFNYLPKYEYIGEINTKDANFEKHLLKEKKEIIIK